MFLKDKSNHNYRVHVQVQMCNSCQAHRWHTWHKPGTYQEQFVILRQFITNLYSQATFEINNIQRICQLEIMNRELETQSRNILNSTKCQKFKRSTINNKVFFMPNSSIRFPRVGAFQIYINNKIVWSKIKQLQWPDYNLIEQIIQKIKLSKKNNIKMIQKPQIVVKNKIKSNVKWYGNYKHMFKISKNKRQVSLPILKKKIDVKWKGFYENNQFIIANQSQKLKLNIEWISYYKNRFLISNQYKNKQIIKKQKVNIQWRGFYQQKQFMITLKDLIKEQVIQKVEVGFQDEEQVIQKVEVESYKQEQVIQIVQSIQFNAQSLGSQNKQFQISIKGQYKKKQKQDIQWRGFYFENQFLIQQKSFKKIDIEYDFISQLIFIFEVSTQQKDAVLKNGTNSIQLL